MDRARLKNRIEEVAANIKNVRHESLVNLIENHIKPLCVEEGLPYDHRVRGSHHVFTLGQKTIVLVKPHGSPFVKPIYVRDFLDAMETISLYEEE